MSNFEVLTEYAIYFILIIQIVWNFLNSATIFLVFNFFFQKYDTDHFDTCIFICKSCSKNIPIWNVIKSDAVQIPGKRQCLFFQFVLEGNYTIPRTTWIDIGI